MPARRRRWIILTATAVTILGNLAASFAVNVASNSDSAHWPAAARALYRHPFGASLVLTAVILVVGLGAAWYDTRGEPSRVTAADVAEVAASLSGWLRHRLAAEERRRRVYDPRPLPVRWHVLETGAAGGAARPDLSGGFDDIGAVFNRTPAQRLVILGRAGAGKSVLVGRLAQELLGDDGGGDRIPYLLPVASWAPEYGLADWVASYLQHAYPALGRRVRDSAGVTQSMAEAIVRSGWIVPVLDGLDELPEALRGQMIGAINDFGSNVPLVVTSRAGEYRAAAEVNGRGISQATVIELAPLDVNAALAYLRDATDGPADRWGEVLDRVVARPDGPLAEVLQTPLTLWLARTIYRRRDRPVAELLGLTDVAELETHLFDGFISAAYTPVAGAPPSRWPVERAQRSLGFLAAHLRASQRHQLAWWRLGDALRGWQVTTSALRSGMVTAGVVAVAVIALQVSGVWSPGAGAADWGAAEQLLFGGPAGTRVRDLVAGRWQAAGPDPSPFGDLRDAFGPVARWLLHGGPAGIALRAGALVAVAALGLGILRRLDSAGRPGPEPRRLHGLHDEYTAMSALWGVGLKAAATWFLAGAVMGGAFNADDGFFYAWSSSATLPLFLALVAYFAAGVPRRLGTALGDDELLGPAQSLRMDRRVGHGARGAATALRGLAFWLLGGWALAGLYLLRRGFVWSVDAIVGNAHSDRAHMVYGEARFWLAVTGRLPWRTMAFLDDAQQKGVLRQSGAAFEFRHARLLEHLGAQAARRHSPLERGQWWLYRQYLARWACAAGPRPGVGVTTDPELSAALKTLREGPIRDRAVQHTEDTLQMAGELRSRIKAGFYRRLWRRGEFAEIRAELGEAAARARELSARLDGWDLPWEIPPWPSETIRHRARYHRVSEQMPIVYGGLWTIATAGLLLVWPDIVLYCCLLGTAWAGFGAWVLHRRILRAAPMLILTSHRLLIRTGVLTTAFSVVPLSAIEELSISRSLIEAIAGSGTLRLRALPGAVLTIDWRNRGLTIEGPGDWKPNLGSAHPLAKVRMVEEPDALVREIHSAVVELRAAVRPGWPADPGPGAAGS